MTSSQLDTETATVSPAAAEPFASILGPATTAPPAAEPAYFGDLNLDQVVDAIVAGRDEYDLRPFFNGPLLRDPDAVAYRHEVFRDLEAEPLRAAVVDFAEGMRRTRRHLELARRQHYRPEQEQWFLDAATAYCDCVSAFAASLASLDVRSRGFRALRDLLGSYTRSSRFVALTTDAGAVRDGLAGVRYTLRIKGSRVTVSTYEDEPDYGSELEGVFRRFRQGEAGTHTLKLTDGGSMDHVEAHIAELVARIFPRELGALGSFCKRHRDFVDATILRFDREVQLYLAVLEHLERIEAVGLRFCYPEVSSESKETEVAAAFDLALAAKLAGERRCAVCNDLALHGPERILVVTGPNQGGKTTFARAFGQLHHFAGLGLPVPAASARLFLADGLFTHFERVEDMTTLRGKLDDELVRIREVLEQASGDSVVVVNEIFASTTLDDAIFLGTEVLRRLLALGSLCVCVTFVDELASLGAGTASMVAGVEPADPSRRTFGIERRPADGRAYAWALAKKYGLSAGALEQRLRQ